MLPRQACDLLGISHCSLSLSILNFVLFFLFEHLDMQMYPTRQLWTHLNNCLNFRFIGPAENTLHFWKEILSTRLAFLPQISERSSLRRWFSIALVMYMLFCIFEELDGFSVSSLNKTLRWSTLIFYYLFTKVFFDYVTRCERNKIK